MNILIVHGRVPNLGDRAIATCMAAQLREVFPGATITFDADEPAVMRAGLPNERVVPAMVELKKIQGVASRLSPAYFVRNAAFLVSTLTRYSYAAACAALGVRGGSRLVSMYRDADLIVWAGGDYVSDIYGPRIWLRFLELHIAKSLGKPVVIYSQTVGPFSPGSYRRAARALRRADRILARDAASEKFLAGIGVTANVRRVADCVITLPPRETDESRRIAAEARVDGSVLFALIDRHYVRCTDAEYDAYEQAMRAMMRRVEERGLGVVLIAAATEDLRECAAFQQRFGTGYPVIDTTLPAPDEVKAVLGRAAALVSSRMHPVILATAGEVPTLGVSPLAKMRDYLTDVGLGDYVMQLQTLESRTAVVRLDALLDNADTVRAALARHLGPMREASRRNAAQVKEVMSEYGRNA